MHKFFLLMNENMLAVRPATQDFYHEFGMCYYAITKCFQIVSQYDILRVL